MAEKSLDKDKDEWNENVKKRLKYFATCFHRHFYKKKDIYFAENSGEVKKKPKSTKIAAEAVGGISDILDRNAFGIRIQKGFDNFGQQHRQKKAKAIFSIFKDAGRVLNVHVIRGACLLFQIFEVQFMKMTVDGKLDTAMDYLAEDAVKRLFNFVEKLKENPESCTTIDHNFIVSSVIMEYSNILFNNSIKSTILQKFKKIKNKGEMKFNDINCETEDIFSRVGLIVRRNDTENNIYCKRINNDGSDIFGFRLNHNSEIEIPTGYTQIDVKTENCERYLSPETLEKIFDDICLEINKDKLVWFNVKAAEKSFVGRDEQLERISKDLENGPVFIVGLNGVGKSELALKYISLNYKQGQHNVVWINAENEQSTTMSFKELHSGCLRLESKTKEGIEKSLTIIKEDVYDYFKDQNVLFVYDNINDRNIIDTFSPTNPRKGLNTIYTSNSVNSEETEGSTIKLMGLTPEETVKIIQIYLPLSVEDDIYKLGKAMNNSPLGLKIAASYIKASKSAITKFLDLLENSNQDKNDFLKQREGCTKAIYSSINITLEHLKSVESDDSKFAVEILEIAAFTSPDNIPLDVFKSMQYQRLSNIPRDDLRHDSAQGKVDRALELLDKYSLLEHRQENEINVHSLVQLTIQTIIQESDENAEGIIENILNTILKAAGTGKYILHTTPAWKHAFQLKSHELWKKLIDQFIANRNGSYLYFHGICCNNELEVVDRVLLTINQHYPTSSFDINEQNLLGLTALHLAALRGSQKIVKILIENKAKLNITNKQVMTPLHCAALSGNGDIVAKILEHPDVMEFVNAKTETGLTAMHMAALEGHLGILQLLIGKGADLNITDSNFGTPLHYAVFNGHANIVAKILEHPEGMHIINAKENSGETALHVAAHGGHLDILHLLIGKGADLNITDSNLGTPLHYAVFNGHADIVAKILEYPEGMQIINAKGGSGETAMHVAAQEGHMGILHLLIGKGAELNITDTNLLTPLHHAALNGHADIVAKILDHPKGMQIINAKEGSGGTAMHVAAQVGHMGILHLLIKKGAELNITDTNLQTPLHCAAFNGHADIVAKILEHPEGMQIVKAKGGSGETAMHVAAQEGHMGILHLLIGKGAELNITDTNLMTPLHYAVFNGHADIVAKILEHPEGMQIVKAKGGSGETAMHVAAQEGHMGILHLLIGKGAELNITDTNLQTPLHYAVFNGHADIVAKILEHPKGMQIINEKEGSGKTAMIVAAQEGHLDILQLLIEKGAELNITGSNLGTPLHYAVINGHADIVDKILEHPKGMQIINEKEGSGKTAMHMAAQKGHLDILHLLIGKGAKLNITDTNLQTPLHHAIFKGHADIVAKVLEHPEGMQILNAKGGSGETAMIVAAQEGHLDILQLLIEKGAELNITGSNLGTPLHYAVINGHADIVDKILEHPKGMQIINEKEGSGKTAMHMAAQKGHLDILHLLIGKGAKLNITDTNLQTPLHHAIFKGHADIVAKVLEHPEGMQILNAKGGSGETAMIVAAQKGHLDILHLLIGKGAKLNITDTNLQTPLHHAIFKGHADIVAKVLEHPEGMQILNAKGGSGETAMIVAAQEGHLDILQLLIEKGAELNITGSNLGTPLHYAVINGHADIVDKILEHPEGMQIINAKTAAGMTAMHVAALEGHLGILQLLIDRGAKLNITDTDLSTPLHCAVAKGHADIVAKILEHPEGMQIINAKMYAVVTAMDLADHEGHLGILYLLIEKGAELNISYKKIQSLLHDAEDKGHADIVAKILEYREGMQIINAKTETGVPHDCNASGRS